LNPQTPLGTPLSGEWRFVCCMCCVLSGRGLCDGLITRPEESYRLWRVVVCDQETLCDEEATAHAGLQSHRRPQPALGCRATGGHTPRWAAEPQEATACAGLQSYRRPQPVLGCRATGGHSPYWAAEPQEARARTGLQNHRRP
jgi:hypothetical protein